MYVCRVDPHDLCQLRNFKSLLILCEQDPRDRKIPSNDTSISINNINVNNANNDAVANGSGQREGFADVDLEANGDSDQKKQGWVGYIVGGLWRTITWS